MNRADVQVLHEVHRRLEGVAVDCGVTAALIDGASSCPTFSSSVIFLSVSATHFWAAFSSAAPRGGGALCRRARRLSGPEPTSTSNERRGGTTSKAGHGRKRSTGHGGYWGCSLTCGVPSDPQPGMQRAPVLVPAPSAIRLPRFPVPCIIAPWATSSTRPPRLPSSTATSSRSATRAPRRPTRAAAPSSTCCLPNGHQVEGGRIVHDEPDEVRRVIVEPARQPARPGHPDDRRHRHHVAGPTFETIDALLEKRLDGFGELFRMLSYEEIGAAAMLSRACAGLAQRQGDRRRCRDRSTPSGWP